MHIIDFIDHINIQLNLIDYIVNYIRRLCVNKIIHISSIIDKSCFCYDTLQIEKDNPFDVQ
ncbi:hypothetical protein MTBBW1_2670011 [Desulfamplus magnetovallimortis]|uniref:Uncharacterized protein n=1 Tax=Desulfamplus magnetovallimortis TaxID=1246637 RepID=A0A1W1HF01_9BACT|nr:hypothetical protein MTBBW1_2670011 [Desulfamplus magnetovallimortis]